MTTVRKDKRRIIGPLPGDKQRAIAAQDGDRGRKACPDCPDGYVWTTSGPTDAECPTCRGNAWVYMT